MAKAVFGQYAAFITKGGVRFQQNNKMISEKAVPTEVVDFLYSKLGVAKPAPEEPKFPMPSPEELARMREESLRVKPELQITPEEEATRALTGVPNNETPLDPSDFDVVEDPIPLPAEFTEPTAPLDSNGNEPLPRADEHMELPVDPMATQGDVPGVNVQAPQSKVDPSFMESVSIHTATLRDMAQALYDRFGIYTVYINQLPQGDEINPLTGGQFTKYHLGIAYQAAIAAQTNGIVNPDGQRQVIDAGRAASENFQQSFEPAPVTMADARQQNSFDFRTAVAGIREQAATEIVHVQGADGQMHAIQRPVEITEHGGVAPSRYDEGESEQILEPPIFGTKPIIRPNW